MQLTERELQVARKIAAGMSNDQAAKALDISPRTVQRHLENIYNKNGFRKRTRLAVEILFGRTKL